MSNDGITGRQSVKVKRIVGDAVRICYRNPRDFLLSSALVGLPALAFNILNIFRDPSDWANPGQGFLGLVSLALVIGALVLSIYLTGAIPVLTAHVIGGRPLTWTEAFSWVKARRLWGGIFLVLLLTVLALIGGLLLLIIPGIIFGGWFMLSVPARVLGDYPGTEALAESRKIMGPVLFRGGLLLGGVLYLPLLFVIMAAYGIFGFRYGFMSGAVLGVIPPAITIYLVTALWMPVTQAALTLLYIERAGGLSDLRADLYS